MFEDDCIIVTNKVKTNNVTAWWHDFKKDFHDMFRFPKFFSVHIFRLLDVKTGLMMHPNWRGRKKSKS